MVAEQGVRIQYNRYPAPCSEVRRQDSRRGSYEVDKVGS